MTNLNATRSLTENSWARMVITIRLDSISNKPRYHKKDKHASPNVLNLFFSSGGHLGATGAVICATHASHTQHRQYSMYHRASTTAAAVPSWLLLSSRGLMDRTAQIYRNMLFLTLLFMLTGWPSSSSNPAAPPSPDMDSNFSRSSSSNSACVFFFLGTSSAPALGLSWSRTWHN